MKWHGGGGGGGGYNLIHPPPLLQWSVLSTLSQSANPIPTPAFIWFEVIEIQSWCWWHLSRYFTVPLTIDWLTDLRKGRGAAKCMEEEEEVMDGKKMWLEMENEEEGKKKRLRGLEGGCEAGRKAQSGLQIWGKRGVKCMEMESDEARGGDKRH